MLSLPVVLPEEPPLRVYSLPALLYCERLFYLEEVENIHVANEYVYGGRQLHAELAADEDGEAVQVELSSDSWGLVGKVDCLRRRDGSYIPYEHKRGRPQPATDDQPARPWPSDRLQVIAYAVLLEEAFEKPVPEGRIRYHATQQTLRVPVDQQAKDDLRQAIVRARQLRASLERPAVTTDERRCAKCSLAPVCLPEEVRHQRQPHRPVERLFPPDRDGATLHIVAHGSSVGCAGDSLVVRHPDLPESRYPAHQLEALLIHGFSQISTQALRVCVQHEISVHWLHSSGHHFASLVSTVGQVQRRIRQYRALTDETLCLRLARALALAKVSGQYRYLLRATRNSPTLRQQLAQTLEALQQHLRSIARAADRDALRGLEGIAAVHYFTGLRALLNDRVPVELRSSQRSRRPPLDRFNALLSYGYGLLHTAVLRALLASGLEPAFGFFHTPRSSAYPLALDLMELFRVPLWDLVVIGSLNRSQWDPQADFEVTPAKVWLSEAGRRKAIALFENRLQENFRHPVLQYSLSYARCLELEARLLEKEWTGEPGLFARARLR
jgi:CRISPR-associated protein Cas1